MRNAERGYFQVSVEKHLRGRGRPHVHRGDVQAHSPAPVANGATQDRKRPGGVEESPHEHVHGREEPGARGTRDLERLLAETIALPEQGREVRDVVGVEMTDREQ